jgi:NitT/TauT family transport system ATP-binding protein
MSDLAVIDLRKRVSGGSDVLGGIHFTVPSGTIAAVVGPSGCGKSALLQAIAGYDRPTSGEILVDGHAVESPGLDRLMVFQENALFPWMTVVENIAFGPHASGRLGGRAATELARALLPRFGLAGVGDVYPDRLSGGMQRRVELLRALINEPQVLLLDEPFRGLDALTLRIMQRYFLELHEQRPRTTLLVTSEIDEALALADQLIVLSARPAMVRATLDAKSDNARAHAIAILREPLFAPDLGSSESVVPA